VVTGSSGRSEARRPLAGPWRALITSAALLAAAGGGAAPAPPPEPSAADPGARLYREGLSAAGAPVPAIVQGDLPVRSTDMPCVSCHRRSGWGTSEGPVTVPPVAGGALFAPVTRGHPEMGRLRTTGAGTRPAYDEPALLRAVRDGVDPAGRALAPTMPRYAIGAADAAALASHLRSLSSAPAPGVTGDTVHLATILTPEVGPSRRASMLDVLRTYVRHKNAGTRNEAGRRERGPWDMARHNASHRTWVLHEWELKGPAAGWPGQLRELYRRRPVFAVLGGLSEDDWTPIHEFSEREGLPAILPQTPLPPDEAHAEDFYSLYFSRGVRLEAAALAERLGPSARRVLQVSRCRGPGGAAAAALVRLAAPAVAVRSECLDGDGAAPSRAGRPDTLVLWLGPGDIARAQRMAETAVGQGVKDVFASSSLLGDEARRLPAWLAARASLLHPFVPPGELDRHAWRALAWMKANGIAPEDRPVAVNALFAAMLAGDALAHPRALVSREYFLERVEHMAPRLPVRSALPAVVFGPQRRFASSACHVIGAPPAIP
jgi:hypothetical protein